MARFGRLGSVVRGSVSQVAIGRVRWPGLREARLRWVELGGLGSARLGPGGCVRCGRGALGRELGDSVRWAARDRARPELAESGPGGQKLTGRVSARLGSRTLVRLGLDEARLAGSELGAA
ncbi:hypothetical protein GCM10017788_79710 [Amycolatopsis acidiphila]|nr:hypothetical protein GCM10017788_79710 [Amycolatopsis acidiphila]